MILGPGRGRLYVELLVGPRGGGDKFARSEHLRPLALSTALAELQDRGATVVSRRHAHESGPDGTPGHRIGRLVVEWRR
jgi:hypothetical protein